MQVIQPASFSFAMLLNPEEVIAAAERVAKADLPRRICRPLDRRVSKPVSADVAAFDATIEETTVLDDDTQEAAQQR